MGGMMTSFTSEPTIVPNAAPMMMPTAMSITLPRMMNSLNSLIISVLAFRVCRLPSGCRAHQSRARSHWCIPAANSAPRIGATTKSQS